MTFKTGDIIVVNPDQGHEPGWLGGELDGKVGWFPEAYVEPASNSVKKPADPSGDKSEDSNLYVALFPYTSEGL